MWHISNRINFGFFEILYQNSLAIELKSLDFTVDVEKQI